MDFIKTNYGKFMRTSTMGVKQNIVNLASDVYGSEDFSSSGQNRRAVSGTGSDN